MGEVEYGDTFRDLKTVQGKSQDLDISTVAQFCWEGV